MTQTERQFVHRLAVMFSALVALTILSAVAFSLSQHVSLGFGLIWTLDTVTTLGTVHEPPNTSGRVIVAVLELLGIGSLFYGFATVAEFFVSGQLSGVLALRRTQRMMNSFTDHYIVCGYGRVGRHVAHDLQLRARDVVVIESNPAYGEEIENDGLAWLNGNASDDEILIRAGIERAAAVLSCVDSDAENIFVTLSARELRHDITIVARSSRDDAEKKLLRAGATRVISPYKTTGAEMARIALHPQINSISELSGHRIEQIEVRASCAGAGKTLADVRGTSVIVALERANGSFEPQPAASTTVHPGDRLIALGTPDALEALEHTFQPLEAA
jgi:voltage-gated potassium channel